MINMPNLHGSKASSQNKKPVLKIRKGEGGFYKNNLFGPSFWASDM